MKLPTLDFKLWMEEDMEINHTFFEKSMKTQLVIPKRSAMAMKQKISINSNDLNRRLSNINIDRMEDGELERVTDHYTSQLKGSGYTRAECKEIIVSGALGWKRRHQRRREENKDFYRSATSTLRTRIKKKLLDPVRWYKEKVGELWEDDSNKEKPIRNVKDTTVRRGIKRKTDDKKEYTDDREVKAVLFCPYTPYSELAKRLREAESNLNMLTGYRMKVVEEAGEKLIDMLRSTNPWKGEHCGREDCWLCNTKEMTGKDKTRDCTRRSIVYETWCETCLQEEIKRIEEQTEEGEERKKQIQDIPRFKYIGETARSAYERGLEHQGALEKLQEDSHLLKHVANKHRGEDMDKIRFGMRIYKQTRTALERQITESVRIQEEQKKHYIMNSKSEYNRCSLPRLTPRMGNMDYDKIRQEEIREEKEEEMRVREEIRVRRKEKCKKRNKEIHNEEQEERENKLHKRRKIEETGQYKTVYQKKHLEEKRAPQENNQESRNIEKQEPMTKRCRKDINDDKEDKNEEAPDNHGVPDSLMDTDWQERRRKMIERREAEEKERNRKIKLAKQLEESWKLTIQCRRFIQENSLTWQELDEKREEEKRIAEREDQRAKAKKKKEEFLEKRKTAEKVRRIDHMLNKLPED